MRVALRAPLLCAAVAFSIRVVALLTSGGLLGQVDYDDSVYLSASQHLLAGRVPYRDFLFLHPPAITVLLLPFAALSHLIGDGWALTLVRLSFAGVGAANAALIAVLLRRYGTAAALTGGLLYATWNAATGAETTGMLEPLLNLALLVTLVLLRRERSARATAAVGLVVGVAVAVKLWSVVDVVVLVALLAALRGWRTALPWLAGALAAAAVVIGPFALLTPARSWRYLVTDQVGRARDDGTLVGRLRYFDGISTRRYVDAVPAAVLVVLGSLAVLGIAYVAVARRGEDAGWWAWSALGRLAVLTVGPSFFYHYAAFAAAPLCLVAGYGASRLTRTAGRVALAPVGAAVLVLLSISSIARVGVVRVDRSGLVAFASRYHCVWAPDYQWRELADVATSDIARGCPGWVDEYGVALDSLAGTGATTDTENMETDDRYQRGLREQLSRSDALILPGGLYGPAFSDATRAYLAARFVQVGSAGSVALYAHR